ncbi:MAG: FAD binding domain-containing protein [Rhabdochlamydiaceae bacterium]
MYDFKYIDAGSAREAVELREKYGEDATFVSGGTNVLYLMKRDVRRPKYLINLKNITGLDSIRWDKKEGLRVGAIVKLSSLQHANDVVDHYPVLTQSAGRIASPQIRNAATVGGNLSQEVWCWYLTENFPCWMNGGKFCFAPGGDNRYHHTVAGGFLCMAIHPSDLAPALYALNAKVNIVGLNYEKEIGIPELLPGYTKVEGKLKQNTLLKSELITSVQIPPPESGSKGVFLKFAARESFDFALASVSLIVTLESDICKNISVVLGGVATMPYKATKVESLLKGKKISPELVEDASESVFDRAAPLSMNAYRIRLARELVRKALLQVCNLQGEDSSSITPQLSFR